MAATKTKDLNVLEGGPELQYRVELYNFGSFCIKEGRAIQTGSNAGTVVWRPIKYPTSIDRLALLLLTTEMGIGSEWRNAQDMVDAVNNACARLEKKIEEIFEGVEIT